MDGFVTREAGSPDAAWTLLLLHGLGANGATFDKVATHPALSPFRLLIPDLPGYGASAHQDLPVPLDQMADLLVTRIDREGAPRLLLVGHSMGGTLAQLIAERHPSRASGLLNVEGNVCLDDCTVSGAVARQSLEEFERSGFDRLVATMERAGRSDPATLDYASSLRLCDPASLHLHSKELVELSTPGDLARRMAALPIPARYVAASPGGAGAAALALLEAAGVPVTVISPSGHSPQFDQPDAFVRTITGFLESIWIDARR